MGVVSATGRSLVDMLARTGYVAKGLVYLAVGVLSLMALMGFAEGRVTGVGGAIHVMGRNMPGRWGFGLLAFGLAAHVFSRFYQAVLDPAEKGHGWRALIQRGGFLVSAGVYLSLVMVTLSAVTGLASSPESSTDAAERVLTWPGGRVLVGLVGLAVVGVGVYQCWRALTQPFRERWLAVEGLPAVKAVLAWIGSLGIGMRAILFLFLGWTLLRAGWFASSDEMADVATSLWRLLESDQYGQLMLAIVACGLSMYGVYCFSNAALRKIEA